LKSITLVYDAAVPSLLGEQSLPRKIRPAAFPHTKSPALPSRKQRLKAGGRLVSIARSRTRPTAGKRH
jgi:hypothetical protein